MEAEPKTEAVGKRDLLFHRIGRVERGRALVLDHLARDQMTAVGGGVEEHIRGPPFDATFEHCLERFVGRILLIEG